jgi:hypothetical protein
LRDETSSPATVLKIESNMRRGKIAGAIMTSGGVICASNVANNAAEQEQGCPELACRFYSRQSIAEPLAMGSSMLGAHPNSDESLEVIAALTPVEIERETLAQ